MGNVRPTYIKRVAMELVQKYPRACSADFENNKVLVSKLTGQVPYEGSARDEG